MKKFNFENLKSKIQNDGFALALLVALVLLFFWRILTPRLADRAIFPPGDFSDQFWMFRVYEARTFAAGRLPLWSENFNGGHPFLADVQSAIFYPLSLIWTLLVVAVRGENFTLFDLELEAVAHFILAGAFTYLFARRVIGARIAALVSAITFTFGGYLTAYPPQQLAILETATWLPLILFFTERGLARESSSPRSSALVRVPFDFICAGITLGIAALAGHPQTFLFVAYAFAIFFAWRVIQLPIANYELRITFYTLRFALHASRFTFYILRFTQIWLIAAGISAAQWLPTLEYQFVSTRATMTWAEAARGFPTLDPLQMILPGFVSAFQSPLYIGILPLWFALFALWHNRTAEKRFWALFALGSLLVAFGFYVFAYAIFYLFVPGFALFRGQERLAFVISFALALLAGYGARDWLAPALDLKRARRAWALLPAGIVLGLLFVCTLYISGTVRQSNRVSFLGDRAALITLLFVLATLLVAARKTVSANVLAGWLIALIAFDLFSVNTQAYNAEPKPRFSATPISETLQNDRDIFRVVDEGKLPGHFGIAYRLEEIGGISPLKIARYETLRDNLPDEKFWALWNVRYVITARPGLANAELVANDGDTRLLRLNDTLPRAWFAPDPRHNPNDADVIAAMASDAFDPWRVAYLADAAPPTRATAGADAHAAEYLRLTPERARVIVNAPADGVLVLSENFYYPGWRATVDGMPAPILRANVALTAVPVRAGAGRVDFEFDPWSVKIGIALTGITCAAVLIATAIGFQRRK